MKKKEMSLGECIRMQRIEMEYSLRDLAPLVGCSAVYLSQIENGKRVPSPKMMVVLAKHLKLNEADLAAKARFFKVAAFMKKTNTDISELSQFYHQKSCSNAEAR
jgi:transcriptional regulator with XRE-family HTH domain